MECDANFMTYLSLVVIFEITAEYFLTRSAKENNNLYLFLGVLSYVAVALSFYSWMKTKDVVLVEANTIWQAANVVGIAVLGVLAFEEKITTKIFIGILFVLFGILLVKF